MRAKRFSHDKRAGQRKQRPVKPVQYDPELALRLGMDKQAARQWAEDLLKKTLKIGGDP